MRFIRPLLASLLITVLLLSFTSCETAPPDPSPAAVLIVDGENIGLMEFRYQLVSMLDAFEYYGGKIVDWEEPIDNAKPDDFFKDQATDSIVLYRSVQKYGEELGLTLTEEELAFIEETVEETIEQTGGEEAFAKQLALAGIDRELYTYILTGPEAYFKIYQSLYAEGGEREPEYTAVAERFYSNYLRTRHIMVYLFDEEGTPLDDATIAEYRVLMEDILSRIEDGGDFETLMTEYNQDTGINNNTITFTQGEMPDAYYNATAALGENESSDILEIQGTLCIVNRLPLDKTYLDENLESIKQLYCVEDFDDILNEYKAKISVEKTEAYNNIDVQSIYEDTRIPQVG